jgi:hypothetical protein
MSRCIIVGYLHRVFDQKQKTKFIFLIKLLIIDHPKSFYAVDQRQLLVSTDFLQSIH